MFSAPRVVVVVIVSFEPFAPVMVAGPGAFLRKIPMEALIRYPRTGILETVRRVLAANEKPLHWVGSSKRDFLEFPHGVKDDMGNALGIAQFGGTAPTVNHGRGWFGRAGDCRIA